MKKSIEGYMFNRIEKLGGKEYNHLGFESKGESFEDLLLSIVPEVGMKKNVRLTIEILDE